MTNGAIFMHVPCDQKFSSGINFGIALSLPQKLSIALILLYITLS